MSKVKIYTLTDPRTNEIRYVGKTVQSLNYRLACHIYQTKRYRHHNSSWIKSLLKLNLRPIIEELDEVDESKWVETEIYWIAQLKAWGFKLNNHGKGGEGIIGLKHTDEAKEKMSKAHKGRIPWNKGKINCFSKSTIEKLSLKAKGRLHSNEIKKKLSELNKGKKLSQETKEKLKESTLAQFNIQPLKFTNINTGESLVFSCKKDAAKYFKVYPNTITTAMKRKDLTWRKTYKINIA